MSLLSPLLPAPPKFLPSLKLGIARQPHAWSNLPFSRSRHATSATPPSQRVLRAQQRARLCGERHFDIVQFSLPSQRMEIMAVARGRWRRRLGRTSVAIMSKLQNLTQQNQAKSHTAPHDATANHPDWILQSLSASLTSDALRFGPAI